MLHLYHEFIRSIRSGDLELYICLLRIINCFFNFNHPNYTRWLVQYHDNFLKLSKTHVYGEFNKGCFGIKRTKKDFLWLTINLTMEHKGNADTGSQQLEFHILRIQSLQDSDGLTVTLSEWGFFPKFLLSLIWRQKEKFPKI